MNCKCVAYRASMLRALSPMAISLKSVPAGLLGMAALIARMILE